MRKTINVGDIEVPLRVSGATPELYEDYFGRDLMEDFSTLIDSVNNGEKIEGRTLKITKSMMYIMAKQADKRVSDEYIDWLDQFEDFPVEDFAVDVVRLFAESLKTKVERKNV